MGAARDEGVDVTHPIIEFIEARLRDEARLLASLWGDHPGYRAEWRPDAPVEQ